LPLWRISSPKNDDEPDFYLDCDSFLREPQLGEVMSQPTI
jgi:hypothetical protein